MSDRPRTWYITAAQTTYYEVEIECETPEEAERLAREAIIEGTNPDGVMSFYENEEPLSLRVIYD